MNKIIQSTVLVILMSCITSVGTLYAQNVSFGVKAGVDFANWGGKDVKDSNLDINPGFHIGGFVESPLTRSLELESGLYLATKGFRGEEIFEGIDLDVRSTSYYLDLPVLVKYSFPAGFNLFAGPQFSYLLNNKWTWEFDGEKESEWDKEGANNFDLGLVAGTGYKFQNGLRINANYDLGLSKLGKDDSSKVYNRVVKVSVGYIF
jgi:hypothetical protein